METVLVDTDIVIEVLRGRNADLLERWVTLGASEALVVYSPVTEAEIFQGVRENEVHATVQLLSTMICIAVDASIGRCAGEYLRQYRASHGLALGDALIAATASMHGLRLWTRNRKHFPMSDVSFF